MTNIISDIMSVITFIYSVISYNNDVSVVTVLQFQSS